MFDRFQGGRAATVNGRFAEDFDAMDVAGRDVSSSFGAIASYQVCACCAGFHSATTAADGGGGPLFGLNADDRGVFGPNGKPSLSSTDAGAQITRANQSWASGLGTAATVSYAFRDSVTTMPTDTTGFSQFNATQIAASVLAFAAWSDVANITFQRVQNAGSEYSNNATILLGNYSDGQDGAAAFAYLPGGMPGASGFGQVQGDVWINSSLSYNAVPIQLGYGQHTLLHEIGHAIGLSHPAAYNASAGGVIDYDPSAIYYEDSRQYTVMSYFSESNTGGDFRTNGIGANRYASAPLLDDISAAQRLYGSNMTTRTGDTVYGFNSTAGRLWYSANNEASPLVFCAWDAGGIDTFDFSGYFNNGQIIDLRQGSFSSVGGLIGNVSIALGAVIENAIGGEGSDTFRGNSGANRFTPNAGTDVVDGGLGTDTVVFSGARAAYTVTWTGQTGTVVGNGQNVTVTNVEFLQFSDQTIAAAPTGGLVVGGDITNETITGTALADVIGGLGGVDTINGLAGNDNLNGGSGDDTLNGGDDNDILVGALGNDNLNGGAGNDTADYAGAGAGVTVNLSLGGSEGGAGLDVLSQVENVTGSVFSDTLTGDGNANILRGGGGIDTLSGGGGADELYAGAPGEGGGAPDIVKGPDSANGSIGNAISLTGAFDLRADPNIANSTTTPHATVDATTHGGREYYAITVIAGETVTFDIDNASFDTTLRLFTAAGDEMANNDDNGGDLGSGSSTDSALTHTFAIGGTYYIQVAEWVSNGGGTFTSGPPTAGQTYRLHVSSPSQTPVPVTLIGSTLNGDAGADRLEGGAGPDALNGGADDDTLIGGAANDTLNGGDGSDTAVYSGVRSAYTISLSGGVTTISGPDGSDSLTNVERLQFSDGLYDIAGAPLGGAINGTGNADTLNGDSGANTINGLGGDDVLTGGTGDDTIDGGAGTDTAVFSGARAGYTVSTAGATTTVTGPDGADTLTTVERLQFADMTLIVGAGGGQYFAGTGANDTINGTAFADEINGGVGQDTLNGLAGNDLIHGDDGNDVINAGTGVDVVFGDAGTDTFVITAVTSGQPDSTFDGGSGSDTFDASAIGTALVFNGGVTDGQFTVGDNTVTGVEIVRGGSAGDQLNFQAFTTALDLFGGDGDDSLVGGAAADRLYGGLGLDTLTGAAGDQLYGEDGDDSLTVVGSGVSTTVVASGGAGIDTVTLSGASASADLATGVGSVGSTGVTLSAIENILLTGAGAGVRTLLGSSGANRFEVLAGGTGFTAVFDGRGGDDVLIGGALGDTLTGGTGLDQLFGAGGADTLNGDAGDQLYGEDGDDSLVFTGSTAVAGSIVSGGQGTDTARLIGTSTTADLAAGTATIGSTAVTLAGLENVIVEGTGAGVRTVLGTGGSNVFSVGALATGSVSFDGRAGDDLLTGSAQGDTLRGGDNSDVLIGLAGADQLFGDAGDDILRGGAGNDALDGGLGTADVADYAGAAAGVTVNLLTGVASNDGDGGSDTLAGIEVVYGSAFADSLTGDAVNNTFRGGAGVDVIAGGGGIDTVDYSGAAAGMRAQLNTNASTNDGDGGTDTFSGIENLTGSAFNDVLIGDGIANVLRGGLGADTLLGLGGNDTLWGGAGALNTLQGGLGDDTYVLEAADSITENLGEGYDTVDARINTYVLANNVEALIFGGTGNFAGTGNALANVITGGAGNDALRGRGGIDVLNGGMGTDTADYTLAAAGVVARIDLQRATNDGDGATDTYTSIENLIGSNFNDTLIGDNNANVLMGGIGTDTLLGFGGNDILMGGSGGGNNQMQGGQGDDYYVMDAFDTAVEFAGEGFDTVEARIGSYTLGNHIENLLYTGPGGFTGSGNALDNVITGGNQNDVLRGRGGNDVINGGLGADEVQFVGTKAQYTVTVEGAGYRIVDTVAARDGSTFVTSIEKLRFLTGNTTTTLSYPPVAPGALEPADKSGAEDFGGPLVSSLMDEPEVLPFIDDDFVLSTDFDGPQVLPGVDDGPLLARPVLGENGLRALIAAYGESDNPLIVDGPHGPQLLHDRVNDFDGFDNWF